MQSFINDLKALFGFQNKYLVYNILSRNLKLKYRKSYLGFLWTVLVPGANALVYYFVFNQVMRVRLENHFLFLIAGILPWNFFSGSLSQGMESILQNHSLLNKVPLSPHIFTFSDILSSFINYSFSIPILLFIQFFMIGFHPISILYFLILSILLFIQSYSIGLILAYTFVFLRDLRHLISIAIQIWFYLTPIVYQPNMLPDQFRFVTYVNPVAMIFQQIHEVFVFQKDPDITSLGIAMLWTLGIASITYFVFKKYNQTIVENI